MTAGRHAVRRSYRAMSIGCSFMTSASRIATDEYERPYCLLDLNYVQSGGAGDGVEQVGAHHGRRSEFVRVRTQRCGSRAAVEHIGQRLMDNLVSLV